jgi:ABC-type multidrug transport system fused ATPase/permease subunit
MLSGIALALIVLYGGYQAIDGNITVGTVVAFVATLSFLFEPIQQLSQLYTTYQSGMAALEKIFQLLDTKPDLAGPLRTRPRSGPIRGEVQLRGRLLRLSPAVAAARRRGRPRALRQRRGPIHRRGSGGAGA